MADPLARYMQQERVIASSVLDRLLDSEPDRPADPPMSIPAQIRQLRESIRRDLEALLNTRRSPVSPPAHLSELTDSALTYGVDGFVSANLVTDEAKIALAHALEGRIARTETRLTNVHVTILKGRATGERTLKMRIEASFRLQDGMPPIRFETTIDPSSQRFSIEAANE
ncbi:type VI secretion protein [Brucella endophytica]|uniref:Type VI secretion protein n=1 Tax=Brucella endophytica TaxID=1963359 RepID=A0A916S7Y9_9HYPH|nr:type VI secretion system baseplate subunit TssE [Brucella endophytica]GGA88201.1 type VI secretion protein [Brucella endophytica]